MCAGFPRLGVLRRLRPVPDRSVDDGPSPRTALATRCGGRTGTVPVFTAGRLSQEAPDSVPAASPRLRRRHSPWPPGPANTDLPGSFPTRDEGLGAHRYRPRSARFRAGDSLRDVYAGSSRTPLRLARRTRSIWQCWTVPALSRLLSPSPAPPGSGCRQLCPPRCDGVRGEVRSARSAVLASPPVRFPGPPSAPDVRLSPHPALHGFPWEPPDLRRGGLRPWCRDVVSAPPIADHLHPLRNEQRDPVLFGPPTGLAGQIATP